MMRNQRSRVKKGVPTVGEGEMEGGSCGEGSRRGVREDTRM